MPDQPTAPTFRSPYKFRFTPAEWRQVIEDFRFLLDADNSYRVPRRLMGVPVEIIPDHRFT